MQDVIEKVDIEVDGIKEWFRIVGDDAFADIIKGWIESDKDAYMSQITNRRVAVQAGGYCGIFPRLLGQIFDVVYTFEPDPTNFLCLALNCQSPNVIKAQGALGDTHEMVTVARRVQSNRGMHQVFHEASSVVPTYRIDDLNLAHCDFILLDVEGYEHNILRGAENTIINFHPVISVEDTHSGIDDFLSKFGYLRKASTHRDTIYAIV